MHSGSRKYGNLQHVGPFLAPTNFLFETFVVMCMVLNNCCFTCILDKFWWFGRFCFGWMASKNCLFLWRWIRARKINTNEAQNCLFCGIFVCQSSAKTNVFGYFTFETAGDKSEENTAIHDTILRLCRKNTAKTSVFEAHFQKPVFWTIFLMDAAKTA